MRGEAIAPLTDVTLGEIEQAAARLGSHVLDTPFVESKTLSQITGAQVFLKFENLQFTASFKERGALNKLAALVESGVPVRGVIAASTLTGSRHQLSFKTSTNTGVAHK